MRSVSLFLLILCVSALAPSHSATNITVEASGANSSYIDEFAVPTLNGAPLAITVGRDGMVWFTESNVSKVGRFDPSTQSFVEYEIPGVGDMWGITIDHNGIVWFTLYSGKGNVNPNGSIMSGGIGRLGRLDPATGNVTLINIPTVGSFPFRLVADAKNRIWFTELLGNRTGFYDQALSKLVEYEVSKTLSGPADLTFARDGALWFTETFDRKIVRLDTQTLAITEFPLGALVFSPVGIAIDDDGMIWVADHGGDWIMSFDLNTRSVTKYPTHRMKGDLTIPNGLLIDDAGRIWFCEHVGNAIGYFDPNARTMVEFPIPMEMSTVLWLALAPDGDVWFTEWSMNKIGVVPADRPIPISLIPSQKSLKFESGAGTTVTLTVKKNQQGSPNGVFDYTWGTYSPDDISVSFSPQNPSFAGMSDVNVEAKIGVIPNTKPGNYTLGLGVDLGDIRVWSMLQTQVLPTTATLAQIPMTTLAISALVFGGLGILVIVVRLRKRSSK